MSTNTAFRAVRPPTPFCDNGPLAVRAAKESALRGLGLSLEEGLQQEIEFSRRVLVTEDAREGPLAFSQKRKAQYKGR